MFIIISFASFLTLLFANNFYSIRFIENLFVFNNNSLITFFNKNPVLVSGGALQKTETLDPSKQEGATVDFLFKPKVSAIGTWFFRQTFFFRILDRFLCLSKANLYTKLVTKKSLLLNYFSGLGHQFAVSCSFFGVGYRVTGVKRSILTMKLGRSYRVKYRIPKTVTIRVFGKRKSKLRFYSCNLTRLVTAVYLFRCLRWPDAYKGKGVKLTKQKVKIKFREKFGSIHYKAKK